MIRYCDSLLEGLKELTLWCKEATNNLCPVKKISDTEPILNPYLSQWSNIALIITFNFPHHSNIGLLQRLYGPFFKSVHFCSTFPQNPYNIPQDNPLLPLRPFQYINIPSNELYKGYFQYKCTLRVLELNLTADGYLVIGDDTQIYMWNYLDKSRFRLFPKLTTGNWVINTDCGFSGIGRLKIGKLSRTSSACIQKLYFTICASSLTLVPYYMLMRYRF